MCSCEEALDGVQSEVLDILHLHVYKESVYRLYALEGDEMLRALLIRSEPYMPNPCSFYFYQIHYSIIVLK